MISLVRLGFFIQPGKPGKARVLSLCLLEEVDKIASIVRTLGVLRSRMTFSLSVKISLV